MYLGGWVRHLGGALLLAAIAGHGIAQRSAIRVETFGDEQRARTVVVLHGASGPGAYAGRAKTLAAAGFYVLFPHFYDASSNRSPNEANYQAWVGAVDGVVQERRHARPESRISLLGISLGASVALAEGTQSPEVESVVEWSGSLPDFYFEHLRRLPPLLIVHGERDTNVPVMDARQLLTLCERMRATCENRIFADQQHVFDERAQGEAERLSEVFLRRQWPADAMVNVGAP